MRSRWNQVPVSPVSLIRLSSLYFKDSGAAKVILKAWAEPGWPAERLWHRDSVTEQGNTSSGVCFKSKFHLMWHIPSQQEPCSTVSFLYIVHSVSVCAARGCGGLAVGTMSVSTSTAFAFSFFPFHLQLFCSAHMNPGSACLLWCAYRTLHLKGQRSSGSRVQRPLCTVNKKNL